MTRYPVSWSRNAERWTHAEERRLLRLIAMPKPVFWCGKRRTGRFYYAARVLGRGPTACYTRALELQRCRRRKECA